MTRSQIITTIRQLITDPLTRQNTAAKVRAFAELLANNLFNPADDQLGQGSVTGLVASLSTKADLVGGIVPASQLPSYVDDVLEFDTVALLPAPGTAGKIYVITTGADANKQYRWTGSQYTQMLAAAGSTDGVPEGVNNLYFTGARVRTTTLAGYVMAAVGRAVAATDTIPQAIGFLERQIAELIDYIVPALGAKADLAGGVVPLYELPTATLAQATAGTAGRLITADVLSAAYPAGAYIYKGTWNPNLNIVTPGGLPIFEANTPKGYEYRISQTAVAFVTTAAAAGIPGDNYIQVNSRAGIGPGHRVSGAGIPANTRVVQLTGSTGVDLSNATSVAAGATVTFTPEVGGLTAFTAGDFLTYVGGGVWYTRPGSSGGGAVAAPAAPTFVGQDDAADTASWAKDGAVAIASYEYTLDGGTTVTTCNLAQIAGGNIVIAVSNANRIAGAVGLRRKAENGAPPSAWNFAPAAFTSVLRSTFYDDNNAGFFAYSATGWLPTQAGATGYHNETTTATVRTNNAESSVSFQITVTGAADEGFDLFCYVNNAVTRFYAKTDNGNEVEVSLPGADFRTTPFLSVRGSMGMGTHTITLYCRPNGSATGPEMYFDGATIYSRAA